MDDQRIRPFRASISPDQLDRLTHRMIARAYGFASDDHELIVQAALASVGMGYVWEDRAV